MFGVTSLNEKESFLSDIPRILNHVWINRWVNTIRHGPSLTGKLCGLGPWGCFFKITIHSFPVCQDWPHFRSWHLQPWFAHHMFGAERASRFPGNMSSRESISRARPPQEVPTAEWRARRQSVVQATALSAPRTSVAIGELFLQDQKPGAFIKSKKNCKITFIYIIIYHYITDIMCKYNIMCLESGKSSSHSPMKSGVPCPVQSWNHDLLLALNHRSEAPRIPSIFL